MFKVIVVDDEPLVRMALQEIIDWESFGCELVAEFANGKEALAYVRKHPVELAVIDVDMPVMNGLDFLQTLSEEDGMRRPHAVMLSAYSDYDFVRKAFLLGAIDYIVKDDLEENYVAGVIRNALRTIEERTAARQKESREREKRTKEIRRERLPELLQHEPLDGEGHDEESDPDFKHWLQESARSQQVLIDILIDRSAFDPPVSVDAKKSRYIMRAVEQVLVSGTKEAYLVNWHSYHYTAVLFLQPDASLQNLRKRLSGLVQKMMNHLKQYINVSASFGISDPCRGFEHWHACYEQARRLSRLRFYYGIGRAFFPERLPEKNAERACPWNMKPLLRCLDTGDEAWKDELQEGFAVLENAYPPDAEDELRWYKHLLWEIGALIHTRKSSWKDILDTETSPFDLLKQFETMRQVHGWLSELCRAVSRHLDPKNAGERIPYALTDMAKHFIEKHYAEPISLSQVAEWIGVSESYLSKRFVKETGTNFVDYLTRLRVEKAKQMIHSGMKLYEVGENVGYPNQSHFSRVFKKVTGLSPQEYREEVKN